MNLEDCKNDRIELSVAKYGKDIENAIVRYMELSEITTYGFVEVGSATFFRFIYSGVDNMIRMTHGTDDVVFDIAESFFRFALNENPDLYVIDDLRDINYIPNKDYLKDSYEKAFDFIGTVFGIGMAVALSTNREGFNICGIRMENKEDEILFSFPLPYDLRHQVAIEKPEEMTYFPVKIVRYLEKDTKSYSILFDLYESYGCTIPLVQLNLARIAVRAYLSSMVLLDWVR